MQPRRRLPMHRRLPRALSQRADGALRRSVRAPRDRILRRRVRLSASPPSRVDESPRRGNPCAATRPSRHPPPPPPRRSHRRYPKTSRFQPSAHRPDPPTARLHARRTDAPTAEELKAAADAVAAAGAKVKALKAAGATNSDEAVVAGVATLKELKAELAAMEIAAGVTPPPAPEKPKPASPQKKGGGNNQQKKGGGGGGGNSKGGDAEGAGTSSAEEVKALRIAKVAQLRDAGAEPFAYRFDRTHTATQLQSIHKDLADGAEVEGTVEAVCGRVKARRVFGKLAFLSLEDDAVSYTHLTLPTILRV